MPDMIAIIDNDHRIVRVNESMAKRLGRKPEECVGLPCYEVVHGTTAPPDYCPHTRTMKDSCEHIQDFHEEHLGMHLQVSTTPLLDERGQMTGSVHVAHDITARKKAEEELRQSEARLKRAQEIAHLGGWELDLISNTLSWSDEVDTGYAACSRKGYRPEDILGQPLCRFILRRHGKPSSRNSELKPAKAKDCMKSEDWRVRKTLGEVRAIVLKMRAIRDASGKTIRRFEGHATTLQRSNGPRRCCGRGMRSWSASIMPRLGVKSV